jgi:hypothetical protein
LNAGEGRLVFVNKKEAKTFDFMKAMGTVRDSAMAPAEQKFLRRF